MEHTKNPLILPIKKKWYDMIKSGEKKQEYREISPHYLRRLPAYFGTTEEDLVKGFVSPEQQVILRNGYAAKSPSLAVECFLRIYTGNPAWGAEEGKLYFVLCIRDVIGEIDCTKLAGIWENNGSPVYASGKDPLWKCPDCEFAHLYGGENQLRNHVCPRCQRLMVYPESQ